MDLGTYQELAARTAFYPREAALTYTALGLAGEAGEVANKTKKEIRDGTDQTDAVIDELGDVLWYVALHALERGYSLEQVARQNVQKLAARHPHLLTEEERQATLF